MKLVNLYFVLNFLALYRLLVTRLIGRILMHCYCWCVYSWSLTFVKCDCEQVKVIISSIISPAINLSQIDVGIVFTKFMFTSCIEFVRRCFIYYPLTIGDTIDAVTFSINCGLFEFCDWSKWFSFQLVSRKCQILLSNLCK